ncbi:MAG: cupin domain-containing protein [Prevotella sp.]|nr:cupin domain-containing protein [Prevotella sp.]
METLEKGKAFVPNEVIDYARGGIVSKEFIRSRGGSVTLFAFDEGQQLSEHQAPFDAVLNIIDGEMELTVNGTLHRLHSGEMFVIPADAPHTVNAVKPFKMMITMIRG